MQTEALTIPLNNLNSPEFCAPLKSITSIVVVVVVVVIVVVHCIHVHMRKWLLPLLPN